MKKVKIMLTAIVVMAVVGGALAFKVKTDLTKKCVYTASTDVVGGQCDLPILTTLDGITTQGANVFLTTRSTTSNTTDPAIACPAAPTTDCTVILTTFTEE